MCELIQPMFLKLCENQHRPHKFWPTLQPKPVPMAPFACQFEPRKEPLHIKHSLSLSFRRLDRRLIPLQFLMSFLFFQNNETLIWFDVPALARPPEIFFSLKFKVESTAAPIPTWRSKVQEMNIAAYTNCRPLGYGCWYSSHLPSGQGICSEFS